MRAVLLMAALGALASSGAPAEPPVDPIPQLQLAQNTTCFKTGENAPANSMTKICYYDCLGSPVAITISSTSLCPLTIKR